MAICYNNLWKLLIDKNKKKTDLIDGAKISTSILAKMGRNEYVSLKNIDKICSYLNCNPNDVFEFIKEKK